MNVNKKHSESLSFSEKIAKFITDKIGTMACAVLFALLTFVSLPAVIGSHDIVLIIAWITQTFFQLVLLPIIIVGQNLQSRHSEMRADATYEDTEEIKEMLKTIIDHHKSDLDI